MITKETTVEEVLIKKDGSVKIKEKTIFIENRKRIGAGEMISRTIYPGQSFENETQQIKNIVSSVQTEEVVEEYLSNQRKNTMSII